MLKVWERQGAFVMAVGECLRWIVTYGWPMSASLRFPPRTGRSFHGHILPARMENLLNFYPIPSMMHRARASGVPQALIAHQHHAHAEQFECANIDRPVQ